MSQRIPNKSPYQWYLSSTGEVYPMEVNGEPAKTYWTGQFVDKDRLPNMCRINANYSFPKKKVFIDKGCVIQYVRENS